MTDLSPETLFNLTGRVALITGGGTGIGLMQARALHAAGCRVYITSRREEVLVNAVKTYGFAGYFQADVTRKPDLERLANEVEKKEGLVDILIANAGGSGPSHYGADTSFPEHDNDPAPGGKLRRLSPEEYEKEIWDKNSFENWNDLFNLNTHHILFLAIAFLPLLAKASEKGSKSSKPYTSTFISTGSISGLVKQGQMHYGMLLLSHFRTTFLTLSITAYNASKAAANHLTEAIAFEVCFFFA